MSDDPNRRSYPAAPAAVKAARAYLDAVLVGHEDLDREGLEDTPRRMAKAMREMLGGYLVDLDSFETTTFDAEGYDQVIIVNAIAFASLCEHHVLPFTGRVSVAYLPDKRIIGLSKIPRIVRAVSRRLQVQERMTQQIANTLARTIEPRGVGVVVHGTHSCMSLRGIEAAGEMVTSCMQGAFLEKPEARAEVLRLMNGGK